MRIGRSGNPQGNPGRALHLFLIVLFGSFVVFVPLFQFVNELIRGEPLQEFDVFRRPPTAENLRQYEDALTERSVISRQVRIEYQQWLTTLLSRGNEKVIVGKRGWLFYRPSLDFILSSPLPRTGSSPATAILAFRDTLRSQNVDLIVVPIPGKATIYPEYLSDRYDPDWGPAVNRGMAAFLAGLREAGVNVFDPTELLWNAKISSQELVYIPQETHWSPYGMRLVAQALAAILETGGWLEGLSRRTFLTEWLTVERQGDIYDMLQLPERDHPKFRPLKIQVERVLDAETGNPIEPDPTSPIVLLGDSFTNIFSRPEMGWGDHAGFGEQLARELGMPLDVIALNGGGTTATREALARRPGALSGKRLVIWQFAARDLTNPESEWQKVDLPPPRPSPRQEAGPLVVLGKVALVSEVPDPMAVPYTECLTYLKYRVLSVERGAYDAPELIAVFWGMREGRWMPAARFQEGQVHRLTLEPLAKHPELEATMRADDTEDYELTPFWVTAWEPADSP